MQTIQPQTTPANNPIIVPKPAARRSAARQNANGNRGQAMSTKTAKTKEVRTPELIFAQELKLKGNLARRDEVLYRWEESHFEPIPFFEGERGAMVWLASRFPDRATPSTAKACFAAACLLASKMPNTPTMQTIIPLKNAYLLLNANGTIDRVDPNPAYGITYALNVTLPAGGNTYVPQPVPTGSRLEHYLNTSLPDAEVRDYVQELMGDSLTPVIRFQRAMLLKGKGRNGKSILTRLAAALHQNVAAMQINNLTSFALSPLIGASLAVVDEVPKSGINEQMLKTIISGEEITIDRKHRDPVRYRPTAKWIISTNNDQKTADNSDGFWRRLSIIPFTRQIPESEVVPCLDDLIIKNELQQFLDWCLIGLCRLNERGNLPPEPAAVRMAKQEAIEASNSVIAWVNDQEVHVAPHAEQLKEDVYKRYKDWCDDNRLRALSSGQFWKSMLDSLSGIETPQRRIQPSGERKRFVNLAFGHADDNEPHPFG
ncbi:MAG TPA: phage/plasmid primase, P4 family [Bellilinea sp.]|nr:phage/plasmid primase, P4 family [Bellilinea sp.]